MAPLSPTIALGPSGPLPAAPPGYLLAQATTETPSDEAVQKFTSALVYADSLALAVAVLFLVVAIVFQSTSIKRPHRRRLAELVGLFVAFSFIGNTAILNAYPYSAIVKALGYLLAATILTWRFGREFEYHIRGNRPPTDASAGDGGDGAGGDAPSGDGRHSDE